MHSEVGPTSPTSPTGLVNSPQHDLFCPSSLTRPGGVRPREARVLASRWLAAQIWAACNKQRLQLNEMPRSSGHPEVRSSSTDFQWSVNCDPLPND